MNIFICFGKSRRREVVKTVEDWEGGVELSVVYSFLLIIQYCISLIFIPCS